MEQWSPALRVLLTSNALDVYSRLHDAAARDYSQLREALLRRYYLTGDGYRLKFRRSKPGGESPGQFIVRLKGYLKKWMALSRKILQKPYKGFPCQRVILKFVFERFICLFTQVDWDKMANVAERFLMAHNRRFYRSVFSRNEVYRYRQHGDNRIKRSRN